MGLTDRTVPAAGVWITLFYFNTDCKSPLMTKAVVMSWNNRKGAPAAETGAGVLKGRKRNLTLHHFCHCVCVHSWNHRTEPQNRITEYTECEGTQNNHRVQSLSLHTKEEACPGAWPLTLEQRNLQRIFRQNIPASPNILTQRHRIT